MKLSNLFARHYDKNRNRKSRERDKTKDNRHPRHQAEVERPVEKTTDTTTTQDSGSERKVILVHSARSTPNRKVKVISDNNESDQDVPTKSTTKSTRTDEWRRASSSSNSSEDLRSRLKRLSIRKGKYQPTENDIAEPTQQRKRKSENTYEESQYTYDDASTNSDGGWPPAPTSEGHVTWGFIQTRAQDANGLLMEMKVPVYKKPRQGASNNEIIDTELILPKGYILTQCGLGM